jgi:hypothetical protein
MTIVSRPNTMTFGWVCLSRQRKNCCKQLRNKNILGQEKPVKAADSVGGDQGRGRRFNGGGVARVSGQDVEVG